MPFWDTLEEALTAYKWFSGIGLVCGIVVATFGFAGALSAVGAYYYGARKDELQSLKASSELDRAQHHPFIYCQSIHRIYLAAWAHAFA